MTIMQRSIAVAGFLVAVCTQAAQAAPAYTAREVFAPNHQTLWPEALNDAGATAGRTGGAGYPSHSRSYVRGPHGAYDVFDGSFGGSNSVASSVNARGDVAGYALGTATWLAYYKPVGQPPIELFAGREKVMLSQAWAVNAGRTVVGSFTTLTHDQHAFSWHQGRFTDLPSLGGRASDAVAINDAGVIAGTSLPAGRGTSPHAVKWEAAGVTDLGGLGHTEEGGDWVAAINGAGWVVGSCRAAGGQTHGCVWHDGQVDELFALDGTTSGALGINDANVVVGMSNFSGPVSHAVLWKDGVIADLNDLVVLPPDVYLMEAVAINASGQIVVHGRDATQYRHFVLTPIPAR